MESRASSTPEDFEVEVFFDGECPLCVREVALLKRMDAEQNRIRFTDIQAPGFDAAALGLTYGEVMARIHARLPSGELVTGVEVFRRLYAAVGFRRIVALTRLPVVSPLLGAAYELFAKNRLRLTGRCTPELCERPPATTN